jgi:hypothetical protein
LPAEAQADAETRPMKFHPWLVMGYVAAVLIADTLAARRFPLPFSWSVFRFELSDLGIQSAFAAQFQLSMFLFWFVIPFLFCLRWMDWGWWGVRRWKKVDLLILGGLAIAGLAAVFIIPHLPELRRHYPSLSHLPASEKATFVAASMIWTASWLLGWEFMHRYFLLRHVAGRWPRWGWVIVPIFEAVYHLQKAPLEALGMGIFGLVLTAWAWRRKNFLLPLLAHGSVEVALRIFQIFV